jgi:carbamoyl-phosphate synthase large subunit
MVTEYLPGEEWDSDILCDQGKIYSMVTRMNLRMFGGMAHTTRIERNLLVEKYSEIIIDSLKLSYVIQVAFKKDILGQLKLLEINPRVPGTIIATMFAGVNFSRQVVELLEGKQPVPFLPAADIDILIARYWDERILASNKPQA